MNFPTRGTIPLAEGLDDCGSVFCFRNTIKYFMGKQPIIYYAGTPRLDPQQVVK